MTRNPLQMVRAPFPTRPSLSVLYAALPRPTLLWERPFSPPAPGITSPLLGFPEAAFQLSMSSDHWLLPSPTRNRQVWKAWLEAWPRVLGDKGRVGVLLGLPGCRRTGRECRLRSGGTSGAVTGGVLTNCVASLRVKQVGGQRLRERRSVSLSQQTGLSLLSRRVSVFSIQRHAIGVDGFSPQKLHHGCMPKCKPLPGSGTGACGILGLCRAWGWSCEACTAMGCLPLGCRPGGASPSWPEPPPWTPELEAQGVRCCFRKGLCHS